ncbi:hypothetical protein K469DRAFT_329786 [Zopfia rhizophila CBS 207.26]|uniref:RapZ C-terminal domain-containing protein n=1 Tax=Zopfia rhizophila CBS 207.26 TaxID=1314779 RepID=A0A6A6DLR8_9PEZI|nr:hypothetical protein K469DRAFT_329786 [Zopfia rhizophila CBS 207.26]
MTSSPRPILILCSHGRSPPLNPPPDLKYDLRNVPNPPKVLRDISDGRSKRLREHLLSESKFVQRLELVELEIRRAMEHKIAAYAAESRGAGLKGQKKGTDMETIVREAPEFDGQESDAAQLILRVGCNCALGHHRSVAFVCELAQRPWPKDWHIEAVHRDIEKKRAASARVKQKALWREKKRDNNFVGTEERFEFNG